MVTKVSSSSLRSMNSLTAGSTCCTTSAVVFSACIFSSTTYNSSMLEIKLGMVERETTYEYLILRILSFFKCDYRRWDFISGRQLLHYPLDDDSAPPLWGWRQPSLQ